LKRVLFPGNTIDYTMHNQRLFHLLSYVNCSYSIPSFFPFDFCFSGEGTV
jgi:hypothetical protein